MWVNGKAKEPAPRVRPGRRPRAGRSSCLRVTGATAETAKSKGAGRRPAVREATAKKGTDAAMIAKHSWRVGLGAQATFFTGRLPADECYSIRMKAWRTPAESE